MQIGHGIFLVGISLFSSIFAGANSEYGLAAEPPGKRGIYFCTRDVTERLSKEVPFSKSLADHPEGHVIVNEDDGELPKQIRHCFVLLANERTDLDVGNGKLVVEIDSESTKGYLPDKLGRGQVFAEDRWLFDKPARDEYTISCTPVMQAGDINKRKKSLDIPIGEEDLYSAWNFVIANMYQDAAINSKYDHDKHNSCRVGFESLRKINKKGDYIFNLSTINKADFNVFGCGIAFDRSSDSVVDYLETIVSVGQYFSKITKRIPTKKLTVICNQTTSSPGAFPTIDHGEDL